MKPYNTCYPQSPQNSFFINIDWVAHHQYIVEFLEDLYSGPFSAKGGNLWWMHLQGAFGSFSKKQNLGFFFL